MSFVKLVGVINKTGALGVVKNVLHSYPIFQLCCDDDLKHGNTLCNLVKFQEQFDNSNFTNSMPSRCYSTVTYSENSIC